MSKKQSTNRTSGIYERDAKSLKDWVVEIYSKDQTKWKVLAFPKDSMKSNGGYDYSIQLTDVLSFKDLVKLDENGIHFSPNARYVSVPGLFDYKTASYVKDGLVSRLKDIKFEY